MQRHTGFHYGYWGVCLLAALALTYTVSCSSSKAPSGPGGGGGGTGTQTYVLSLGHGASDIQVHANQTEYFQMTYQIPPELVNIQNVEIDVAASLKHVSVAVPLRPSSILQALSSLWNNGFDSSAVVYLRFGTDPFTVCDDGIVYGPRTVSATSFLSPAPETATLDASIIDLMNTGTLAICAEIVSTVDATFSIDSVTWR